MSFSCGDGVGEGDEDDDITIGDCDAADRTSTVRIFSLPHSLSSRVSIPTKDFE